jgi:hypothetical protein
MDGALRRRRVGRRSIVPRYHREVVRKDHAQALTELLQKQEARSLSAAVTEVTYSGTPHYHDADA